MHESSFPIRLQRMHGRNSLHFVLEILHLQHATEDRVLFAFRLAFLISKLVGATCRAKDIVFIFRGEITQLICQTSFLDKCLNRFIP
jgi:hypothetical protein